LVELFNKINSDLQSAMKSKDDLRLEVLRMMKSKVLLVNARGALADAEIVKIIQKYAKSLKYAIEETKKVNRPEAVAKLESELKIVEQYLPKMLSEAEIKTAVDRAVAEVGASSPKDMGKVMKAIMATGLNADGAIVSRLVAAALNK